MKRSGPSDSCWEKHKAAIKKYYIEDDLPLKEVANMMRINFHFDALSHMYKARFKEWDFQKYNRDVVIQAIVRKLTERDEQGKSTIVYLHGKEITRAEVMRYLNRKGIRDLGDAFKPGGLIPSKTPSGLTIKTPNKLPGHIREAAALLDPDTSKPGSDCDISGLKLPDGIENFLHSTMRPDEQTLDLSLLQDMFPLSTPTFAQGAHALDADNLFEHNVPLFSVDSLDLGSSILISTFDLFDLFDQLPHGTTPGKDLLFVENLGERFDIDSRCPVFGNGPMHQAILHTATPVMYDSSRVLVDTIRTLLSRGADAHLENHAGLTPSDLAYSLGLGFELEMGCFGYTGISATERPPPFCSPRLRRWLEDYHHYAILGCRPAACNSDGCKWWIDSFRLEQLARTNLLFEVPEVRSDSGSS